MAGPKILILDIETAPLISYTWGLFDQNVGLNQVKQDWHLLSWSAKWLGEKKVMYMDQRHAKDIENDAPILLGIWKLMDEADIIITQNGINFDIKKLNARFVIQGMKPPSPSKHIDTLQLAKKHFGFTSNKLAYMTDKLCTKYKKLTHHKFEGFELWKECLKGNPAAWNEMEKYNKHDVLALEELYTKLAPWGTPVNFSTYHDDESKSVCSCGSTEYKNNGFQYTPTGKYQRYKCLKCGAYSRGSTNLLSKEKRKNIKRSAA